MTKYNQKFSIIIAFYGLILIFISSLFGAFSLKDSNYANESTNSIIEPVSDDPVILNDWHLKNQTTSVYTIVSGNSKELLGKEYTMSVNIKTMLMAGPNLKDPGKPYILDFSGIDENTLDGNGKILGLANYATTASSAPFSSTTQLMCFILPTDPDFKSIGNSYFYNATSLKTVTMSGNNITTIGNASFCNDPSLEYINIPSSVKTIGSKLFQQNTSNKNLQIYLDWDSPEDVTATSTNYTMGTARKIFNFKTPEIANMFINDYRSNVANAALWSNLARYMYTTNSPTDVSIYGSKTLNGNLGTEGHYIYYPTTTPSDASHNMTWSVENQPDGVSIDANSGILHWNDQLPMGTYIFRIKVISNLDNQVSDSMEVSLVIGKPIATSIEINGDSVIDATYKQGGTSQYTANVLPLESEQEVIWSLQTTPMTDEISINNSGLLTWSNTLPINNYNLTITVTNINNNNTLSETKTVSLNVIAPNPTSISIQGPSNLQGTKNYADASQYTISAIPDSANDSVLWELQNAPSGVTISNNGLLEWNSILEVGEYIFTIKATSLVANDIVATKDITLVINETFPTALAINGQGTLTTNNKTAGSSQYTVTASPSDASNKVLWNIATTPITNEISINANGLLEWSKNITSGIYNITLTAISSVASSIRATKNVTLNVNEVLPDAILVSGQSSIKALYGQANSSQYIATTSPENATSDVTWSVSSSQNINTINISQKTGLLSWTDQTPVGSYNLEVKATSVIASSVSGIKNVILNIQDNQPLSIRIEGDDLIKENSGTDSFRQYYVDVTPSYKNSVTWSLPGNNNKNIYINQQGELHWTSELEPATYHLTIKATSTYDSSITDTKSVTLILYSQLIDFKINSQNKLNITGYFKKTSSVDYSVTTNNGADSECIWELIDAPSGIKINQTTGVLTWNDNLEINTYTFKIKASSIWDADINDTINVTLEIIESPSDSTTTYIIIGAAVGIVVLMIIVGTIIYDQKRRKRQRSS